MKKSEFNFKTRPHLPVGMAFESFSADNLLSVDHSMSGQLSWSRPRSWRLWWWSTWSAWWSTFWQSPAVVGLATLVGGRDGGSSAFAKALCRAATFCYLKKIIFFLDFFCHGVVLCGDLLGSRLRREEVPNRETVEQSGEKDSIFWPNWTKLSRNLLWFYVRGKGWTNFDGFSGVSAEFLLPGLASTEATSPTSLPPSPSSAAWYILRIKSSKSSWRLRQQRPNWQATCILVTVPGLAGRPP